MNSDPNPLEPISHVTESMTGWGHLSKTALPMLGRVGAIIGGIFSLLAVFKQISGEIITTIEGFVLVVAVISSGIVVFYRTTQVIDDRKVSVYGYPKKGRIVAAIVMVIAGFFLGIFLIRLWIITNPNDRSPIAQSARQTALANSTVAPERSNKPGQAVIPRTPIAAIPSATNSKTSIPTTTSTATITSTPLPPTRTYTPATLTLDQITDVNTLNKLGNDALAGKRYSQAVNIFTRAVFIEATNAQAQLGLGQAYFYQNNLAAATQPLQIALGLDSKLHDAHAFLGWIYDYRQDKAKAMAEYDVFLQAAPRDDPWRADISDRIKLLRANTPAPTLTPNSSPTATK